MRTRRAPCPTGALVVAAACLMPVGCTVGPDYHRPEVTVPAGFAAAPAPADSGRWWQAFKDPQLDALVERAIAGNPDVEVALARVEEARLERVVVLGALLPTIEGSAATAIGTGDDLTRGRSPDALRSGESLRGNRQVTSIGGIDTVWEIDLFGRGRRALEAAADNTEAQQDRRRAVLTCVIAEVVQTYFEVRGLQVHLQTARMNVASARRLADLRLSKPGRAARNTGSGDDDAADDAPTGGADSGAKAPRGPDKHERRPDSTRTEHKSADEKAYDVNLAESDVALEAARASELEQQISAAAGRLVRLAGASEPDIAGAIAPPARLPSLPGRLRPGTPVELLRRRPDIRAAERELAAATARIGVATADLFPTAAVAAGVGVQGADQRGPAIGGPLQGPIWSVGPDAYWRVLDFGRLDALVGIKELRTHEAFVTYRKTIIDAVEEVNEAVRQYHQGMVRARAMRVAQATLGRARDVIEERYRRGEAEFDVLLEVQRRYYEVEEEAVRATEAGVLHYIKFHKALGTGWEFYDAVPPLPPPQPAVVAAVTRFLSGWHRD